MLRSLPEQPVGQSSGPAPLVRLTRVAKSFGDPGGGADGRVAVLSDVDLTIWPGQKASLIGPSGSGKSTLLSLIAGLLTPDTGTVVIDGTNIGDLDDRARARLRSERVGIALQSENLIPFLSARENVELAIGFTGRRSRGRRRSRANDILARFDVGHCAAQLPRHLSGGEAQRVALAVAMVNNPAVLLADEVVASLDEDTTGLVLDEVLRSEFAVLFVTHDLAIADQVDHRYELVDRHIRTRVA